MDTDLVGVIVAATCIGILLTVIITFLIYCYFRRVEALKRAALVRKDSGSVSTNGAAPRWTPAMMPSAMPVYGVPTEPMVYAVPASHYYLGHYAPKFIDSERLEYMREAQRHGSEAGEREEEERQRYVRLDHEHQTRLHMRNEQLERHSHDQQEPETQVQENHYSVPVEITQPNGHVLQDFSASSVNYKVIRKHHKHEKMPDWLRKSYDENERSMDINSDDGSRTSSVRSTRALIVPDTKDTARVIVSSQDSSPQQNLQVAPDYTVVDFVDPEQRTTSFYDEKIQHDHPSADITTTSSSNYNTTTVVTTSYEVQEQVADASHASVSTYVPPASTSTPRPPPLLEPGIEFTGMGDFRRMRKSGEGSIRHLPNLEGTADVPS